MRNNTKIKHLVHLHQLLMQISTLLSINVSTNQGCRFFRDCVHGAHLLYSSSSITYSDCCCHAAVQRRYEMCCERDVAREGLDWPAGKPVDTSRGKEASRGARTKRSPAQKMLGQKQSLRGGFESDAKWAERNGRGIKVRIPTLITTHAHMLWLWS